MATTATELAVERRCRRVFLLNRKAAQRQQLASLDYSQRNHKGVATQVSRSEALTANRSQKRECRNLHQCHGPERLHHDAIQRQVSLRRGVRLFRSWYGWSADATRFSSQV